MAAGKTPPGGLTNGLVRHQSEYLPVISDIGYHIAYPVGYIV
jgi:hypothetical protein